MRHSKVTEMRKKDTEEIIERLERLSIEQSSLLEQLRTNIVTEDSNVVVGVARPVSPSLTPVLRVGDRVRVTNAVLKSQIKENRVASHEDKVGVIVKISQGGLHSIQTDSGIMLRRKIQNLLKLDHE